MKNTVNGRGEILGVTQVQRTERILAGRRGSDMCIFCRGAVVREKKGKSLL